jgi:hypothetical protein
MMSMTSRKMNEKAKVTTIVTKSIVNMLIDSEKIAKNENKIA